MYQLIVFLPLLGFLIAGIFGPWIGARGAEYVTCSLLGVCFVLSWIAFVMVAGGSDAHVAIGNWFTSGKLVATWALRIDTLTAVMLVVVTTVSFLVHVYSIGYMADDPSRPRFFAYLSLFTFAMLMLVTADNLVQLFFGWEGVGLMSYLLIGFWYEKPAPNAAAIKAFVVNRVGDFGFSLGIFLTYYLTGSIAFDQVFAAAPGLAGKTVHFIGFNWDAVTLACLLLFMGAMGKSAQFLLHTWLPDAMGGPPRSRRYSCRDHGDGRRLHGREALATIRNVTGSHSASSPSSAVRPPSSLRPSPGFRWTSRRSSPIRRARNSATCLSASALAATASAFSTFSRTPSLRAFYSFAAASLTTAMHHEQDMRAMGGLRRSCQSPSGR